MNDLEALTSNHILHLKGSSILAPGAFEESDQYIRKRWRQVQYLSDLFWKRWSREYLPLLRAEVVQTSNKLYSITGDIVVVLDHTAPCGSWILRKITRTYPDKDGLVRAVQMKTKSGELQRPISKIFLLQEAI